MLTYEQSAQLMTDLQFRGRCKVACLKFADAIMHENAATAGHNTRTKWAQQTLQQPDQVAGQVQPPTVMDPAVQESGATVTDNALQGAVEAVVQKMM